MLFCLLLQEKYFYKVRWRGYGPGGDTWEPQNNLYTCHDVIEEYKSKLINKKRFKSIGQLNCENNVKKNSKGENEERKEKGSKCLDQSKDNFLKYLEIGKIDVFKEDLYSRVKNRSSNKLGNILEQDELVGRKLRSRLRLKKSTNVFEKHFDNLEKLNIQIGEEQKTPLIYASEVGNLNLVVFLLKKGASKNAQDKNGNTALIMVS